MTDWDDAERRVERAHEAYERGRWEEALRELQAAIAINPYNGAWYFNLGLTLDMMDRVEEAIAAYRRALEMAPDDVEILNALGHDCTVAGNYDEAIGHFQRIEEINPAFEPAYCNRILAYSEKGEHELADQMFYLARQYKEKCPQCYFHIGGSLMARGLYDRALWCWQQVLELEPEYPRVHARMAEAFWAKGLLGEARQHFLEDLRADPGGLDTLLNLGELLVEMGQTNAAAEKFRQVLELHPDESTAHFQLGLLALGEGDLTLAVQQFRRVLRIDTTYPGAHLKMAQIYHRQADAAEALYHANSELAQQQLDEPTLLELGNLLMDLGQLDGAETAFRRRLEANPQNTAARHNLAVALLLHGRIDDGIEQCKLALRSQPKHMLAMHNLALAYKTKGDFVRARYWLREALDIAPEDPQLRQLQTKLRVGMWWQRARRLAARLAGKRRSASGFPAADSRLSCWR